MIETAAFADGLSLLTSDPMAWLVVLPGLLIGLVFGAVPGLSISIAMAVFLPATLYMDFLPAILFLSAIFTGGGFGGAVPAILLNIPGTSSAVATAFDGYPMSQKGRHGEALGVGLAASALGTSWAIWCCFSSSGRWRIGSCGSGRRKCSSSPCGACCSSPFSTTRVLPRASWGSS